MCKSTVLLPSRWVDLTTQTVHIRDSHYMKWMYRRSITCGRPCPGWPPASWCLVGPCLTSPSTRRFRGYAWNVWLSFQFFTFNFRGQQCVLVYSILLQLCLKTPPIHQIAGFMCKQVCMFFLFFFLVGSYHLISPLFESSSLQDGTAVQAHTSAPECRDDCHHVCHAPPLLHLPKHQPDKHKTT